MMHLSRFSTRFALVVGVEALLMLAESPHLLQLACAALLVWVVLELWHVHRQRHRSSASPRPH